MQFMAQSVWVQLLIKNGMKLSVLLADEIPH